MREFADEKGCRTYTEIAEALDGPFAPIQIVMAIRAEYDKENAEIGFLSDCLARYLTEYIVAPSTRPDLREKQAAQAIGACGGALGANGEDVLLQAWGELRERVIAGWVPSGPSDEVLLSAVMKARR